MQVEVPQIKTKNLQNKKFNILQQEAGMNQQKDFSEPRFFICSKMNKLEVLKFIFYSDEVVTQKDMKGSDE